MGECDFSLSDEPSVFRSVQHLSTSRFWMAFQYGRKGQGKGTHNRAKPQLQVHITNHRVYLTDSIFLYVRCYCSLLNSHFIFQCKGICRTSVTYLYIENIRKHLRISINELHKLKLSWEHCTILHPTLFLASCMFFVVVLVKWICVFKKWGEKRLSWDSSLFSHPKVTQCLFCSIRGNSVLWLIVSFSS